MSLKSPLMGMYQNQPMMSASQGPPPSPPRFGYVAGVEDKQNLVGFVGEKPAVREEGGNPAQRRQMPSLASPDPILAQTAFTQSQFTQAISQGANQAQNVRANPETQRSENLKRYMESQGNRYGGSSRGSMNQSCGYSPSPLFQFQPQASPSPNLPQTQTQTPTLSQTQIVTSPAQAPTSQTKSYIGMLLQDQGLMYKAFTSSSPSWLRISTLIIPEKKKLVKVYVTSVMPKDATVTAAATNEEERYSLRVVDPNDIQNGRPTQYWVGHEFDNTESFQRHTIEFANGEGIYPKSGMLELQSYNMLSRPILVSAITLELAE